MPKDLEKRKGVILRLLLVIIFVFIGILITNKTSIYIIIGIIAIVFSYLFLKDYLWIFLVISIPSLSLGKCLYIPITTGWIYEARLAEVFLGLALIGFLSDKFLKVYNISIYQLLDYANRKIKL